MDLKNSELLAVRAILPPVIAAVPAKEQKLKYRLNKDLSRAGYELENKEHGFDQADAALVEAHTAKDEDGNPVRPLLEDGEPDLTKVTIADPAAFVAARNELLATTVSVDLMKIPVSWFEGLDVPTDDLFRHCDFLIDDDTGA